MSSTTTVSVEGMTCNHCVGSVTKELMSVPGVTEVSVELVPEGLSRVTIESEAEVAEADISEAIVEAGYEMVGSKA